MSFGMEHRGMSTAKKMSLAVALSLTQVGCGSSNQFLSDKLTDEIRIKVYRKVGDADPLRQASASSAVASFGRSLLLADDFQIVVRSKQGLSPIADWQTKAVNEFGRDFKASTWNIVFPWDPSVRWPELFGPKLSDSSRKHPAGEDLGSSKAGALAQCFEEKRTELRARSGDAPKEIHTATCRVIVARYSTVMLTPEAKLSDPDEKYNYTWKETTEADLPNLCVKERTRDANTCVLQTNGKGARPVELTLTIDDEWLQR